MKNEFLTDVSQNEFLLKDEFLKEQIDKKIILFEKNIDSFCFDPKKTQIYMGKGPSGPLHLGHLINFYIAKHIQKKYGLGLVFMISDDEKEFSNPDMEDKEFLKNKTQIHSFCSSFFEKGNTNIFFNSNMLPKFYPFIIKLLKKTRLNKLKKIFGYTDKDNCGSIFYPFVQYAPLVYYPKNLLIICGNDQVPYFRISKKFCYLLVTDYLPDISGNKMSSSTDQSKVLALHESKEELEKKINKMVTGGQKTSALHKLSGGYIANCIPLTYFRFFESSKMYFELEKKYQAGQILDSELKKLLLEKLYEKYKKNFL